MKSLEQHLSEYFAYHMDARNRATHMVGIPLTTFAIFLFLGFFRFSGAPDHVSLATVFFAACMVHYYRLDKVIAGLVLLMFAPILYFSEQVAILPFKEGISWFVGSFVVGLGIQLWGHKLEGRKPAFVDNLSQIFNAPLLMAVELLNILGLRDDLSNLKAGNNAK